MSDKIYHYTKKSTALEKILPSMQLRFSNIGNTNDPRETKEIALSTLSLSDDSHSENPDFWQRLPERFLYIRNNEFKLISFCQHHKNFDELKKQGFHSPYIFGYTRSRMWAQYAKNNSGICLEFDKKALTQRIQTDFMKPGQEVYCNSVIYDDFKSGYFYPIELPNDDILDMDEIIRQHIIKNYKSMFFYKSEDWQNEFEYRWILHTKDHLSEHFVSISDSLKSVIVGPDFPKADEPSLIDVCKDVNIPIGRLFWQDGEPLLGPTVIHNPK